MSAFIWGRPYNGSILPEQIPGSWKLIKYFLENGFAIDSDGYLWATGKNVCGVLGVGDTTEVPYPDWVKVGTSKWKDIAQSGTYAFGIQEDGTLWHWGTYLYVGASSYVPVLLDAGDWKSVHVSVAHESCLAIKQDGSLYSWGYNSASNLGHYDDEDRPSPSLVDSGPWLTADISDYTGVGVKENGTLWVWGQTFLGEYASYSSIPLRVGGDANWTTAATALNAIFAIKADGTMWSWGYTSSGANYGLLGLGDVIANIYEPTQIIGSSWVSVSSTYGVALALDSDGALYAWGYSNYGALCIADTTLRYEPTLTGVQEGFDICFTGYQVSGAYTTGVAVSVFWTNFRGQTEGLSVTADPMEEDPSGPPML